MKIFKDRESAGQLLAKRLKGTKADLVLGIPRGGVVVAEEIAKELKLPLDIVVVRKIGAPWQSELALGALDPDGEIIWEGNLREDLNETVKSELKELKRREDLYRNGRKKIEVQEKTIILVDDGVATGSTVSAAIKYLKRHGAKIILAVPVASKDSLEKIKVEADEIVVLETPEYFEAVGQFYSEFLSVSDEEVISLLNHE